MRNFAALLLFSAVACKAGNNEPPPPPVLDTTVTASPTVLSSFGDELVTIQTDKPVFAGLEATDIEVKTGATKLIFLEKVDDSTVRGITQGHPAPSADNTESFLVDVLLTTPEGSATQEDAVEYLPPKAAVFNNVYGIGASFTAGTQSNSMNFEGQRNNALAKALKNMGAFFPQPYIVGDGIPPEPVLEDVDPETGLVTVEGSNVGQGLIDLVNQGGGTLRELRADSSLSPHNLAVPGIGVRHILNGTPFFVQQGDTSELGFFFFEVLIQQPESDVFAAIADPASAGLRPAIQILEDELPTAIFSSVDFFGNDVSGGDDTPTQEIFDDLLALFERIAAIPTQPPFFSLSLIDVNLQPTENFSQDERYESIRANQALIDAANQVNAELVAAGKPPRIFIGDFFSPFFTLLEATPGEEISIFGLEGTVVAGSNGENDLLVTDANGDLQRIGTDLFEGIFSFDALHLTNTGYGVLSNGLIAHVNASIGPKAADPRNRLLAEEIPFVDIAEILASDPLSPKNIEAARIALNTAQGVEIFPDFSAYQDESALPPLAPWDRCALTVGPFQAAVTDLCPAAVEVSAAQQDLQNGQTTQISAEVRDQNGNPMPGVLVSFFIDREGDERGRVGGDGGVLTDANGVATANFTAGFGQGATRVQVQAGAEIGSVSVNQN
jgi:hypothetical protein